MPPRGISLRPTGADNTYRRRDYLRGSVICFVLALGLLGVSLTAGARGADDGMFAYVSFAGALLGLVGLAAAIIFTIQAIIGSPEPAGFALPTDHVPVRFRDGIREILVKEWNPQRREQGDIRAYDSYLSGAYVMASHNLEPESIASVLEQVETNEGLFPGSDEAGRMKAAERLLELVVGRPLSGVL